mmetsp:Transcript_2261/g.5877  ORF Transcript_2261/g.5877 Transcript_2261/m.5877 type:complete len:255 (-) Transcript_2261:449-1213(-)
MPRTCNTPGPTLWMLGMDGVFSSANRVRHDGPGVALMKRQKYSSIRCVACFFVCPRDDFATTAFSKYPKNFPAHGHWVGYLVLASVNAGSPSGTVSNVSTGGSMDFWACSDIAFVSDFCSAAIDDDCKDSASLVSFLDPSSFGVSFIASLLGAAALFSVFDSALGAFDLSIPSPFDCALFEDGCCFGSTSMPSDFVVPEMDEEDVLVLFPSFFGVSLEDATGVVVVVDDAVLLLLPLSSSLASAIFLAFSDDGT